MVFSFFNRQNLSKCLYTLLMENRLHSSFFSSYRISHSTNVIDRQQYAIIHPINEAQKQQKQHFSKKKLVYYRLVLDDATIYE